MSYQQSNDFVRERFSRLDFSIEDEVKESILKIGDATPIVSLPNPSLALLKDQQLPFTLGAIDCIATEVSRFTRILLCIAGRITLDEWKEDIDREAIEKAAKIILSNKY